MRIISWFPSKLQMTIIWIHRFKFICYAAFCCHLFLLTFKLFHLWLMETLWSWLLSSSDMTQWCLVDSLLEWQVSMFILCVSCPSPGISHFPKELWFLLMDNGFKTTVWALRALIATEMVIDSRLLDWRNNFSNWKYTMSLYWYFQAKFRIRSFSLTFSSFIWYLFYFKILVLNDNK